MKIRIPLLAIIAILFLLTISCSKSSDNSNPSPTSQNPAVTTEGVSNIAQTTATGGGNVTSQGSTAVTARGICWSTSQNPTIVDAHTTDGSGTGSFTSNMAGLTANTPYYVRAYATNNSGTGYGNQQSFRTQQGTGGTVTDIDGNVYHIVTIGTQVWMVENLKTTKFNDGSSITLVTDNSAWSKLTTPGYCWQNNHISNKNTYGALYNWYTVNTGKLAPQGWHVSTFEDWDTLNAYLGSSNAGGKIKTTGTIETGTGLWHSPNTGATNSSGFTGLPGGYRIVPGDFDGLGSMGGWWTTFKEQSGNAWSTNLFHDYESIGCLGSSLGTGFSVRCVQD